MRIPMDQNNWLFHCPPPSCGQIAAGYYNAGPMNADDRSGPTAQDSHLQIVSLVTEADFDTYLHQLKAAGMEFYLDNTLGSDRAVAFLSEGRNYHLRWVAKRQEMRIIEEPQEVSSVGFSYSAKGDGKTTVYQYGLYYDPDNNMTPLTCNCGMLYIFHLSDNSLFMMDAGFYLQWNEEAAAGLWNFLRRITGTENGGTVRICGWYFTHTHADHIDGCVKLLNRHHGEISVERFLFNFPLYANLGGYEPSGYYVKEQAAKWYPDAKFLKLHTGQKIHLCDLELEVFYTQEDAVVPEAITKFPMRDGNCMSTILKATIDGKTILLLGDTNVETESWMEKYSEPGIWKADMVRVAHHCFNYLDTLYAWIHAPAAMLPNSWGGAHQPENEPKLQAVLNCLEEDQIWYEGGGTDGFISTEDGWKHVFHEDTIGGPYDGSGY